MKASPARTLSVLLRRRESWGLAGWKRRSLSTSLVLRVNEKGTPKVPKTAMFFPGQGTQKVSMLTPLLDAFPRTVKPLIELLDTTLPPPPSTRPLSEIISNGPGALLTETENAQPAILFTSIVILRVMEAEFGFDVNTHVSHFLGHSLGEFSALVAAGVLSLEDALLIVRRRGEVMSQCARKSSVPELDGGPGDVGMSALMVEARYLPGLIKAVEDFIASETLPNDEFLSIANINSSTQIVLSGHLKAIATCICHLRKFSGNDPRAIRLNVSAPFHSPIMAPAVPVVRNLLRDMDLKFKPETKVIANLTAREYRSDDDMRELLARQSMETVRWAESIRYLDDEVGIKRWIGLGPGRVGKNLVGKEVKGGMDRVWGIEDADAKALEKAVRELTDPQLWR
ncbi:[acyl-carrier-protein] S-malonyltransferase [Rhizina undulata]